MPGVKGLSGEAMRGIRAKMMDTNGRPKDSEIQAAEGPPDPELESLIAPQGYSPELVDEVATMETPRQQWLARLFRLPLLRQFSRLAYNAFAGRLYRWNRAKKHW